MIIVKQILQNIIMMVIKEKEVNNTRALVITQKGLEKLKRVARKKKPLQKRKDKKWQMLMYDIPEDKKRERDMLRRELVYLGYSKLQRSIWVSPYSVSRETQKLIKGVPACG